MPQKAFCNDFERLTEAVINITEFPIVPPGDGGGFHIDAPPAVSPGSFSTSGAPAGLNIEGILSTNGTAHVVTTLEDVPPGYDVIGVAFTILLPDLITRAQTVEELPDTALFTEWEARGAEIDRLREGVIELNAWKITVPLDAEGADNSSTRAALVELGKRLDDLKSAMAETMRKWRLH